MSKRDLLEYREKFLSIQAQDFIEESVRAVRNGAGLSIPEHSSSGLH